MADAIAALEATTDEMRNMVVMMSADEEGRNEQDRWRRKKEKREKEKGKGGERVPNKSNQIKSGGRHAHRPRGKNTKSHSGRLLHTHEQEDARFSRWCVMPRIGLGNGPSTHGHSDCYLLHALTHSRTHSLTHSHPPIRLPVNFTLSRKFRLVWKYSTLFKVQPTATN